MQYKYQSGKCKLLQSIYPISRYQYWRVDRIHSIKFHDQEDKNITCHNPNYKVTYRVIYSIDKLQESYYDILYSD